MRVESSGEACRQPLTLKDNNDKRRQYVVLINRENIELHRPWIVASAVGTLTAVLWYFGYAFLGSSPRWPGGSSLPGFVFGVVGGAVIIFEFLLWPRKLLRRCRWGSARTWMAAHIWLGLLCVPLIVLHSGFRWGGWLTTALLVLFTLVIASGAFGLWLQHWLPRLMTDLVPSETVYSQIGAVASRLSEDAEQLMAATCGVPGPDHEQISGGTSSEESSAGGRANGMVVGRSRDVGNIEGAVVQTIAPVSLVPDSDALSIAYETSIKEFLRFGSMGKSTMLKDPNRANYFFQELRSRLAPQAHAAVDTLQRWCEMRRQFDVQLRVHHWLHAWMSVHLFLSVALVLLMFVHIFGALKYWY